MQPQKFSTVKYPVHTFTLRMVMTFPRFHMYGWSHTCSTLQTYKQHIRYVRRYSIKHFKHHHHYFQVIFNPRRACARVTVLVLSVCPCVCVSVHRRRTRGSGGAMAPHFLDSRGGRAVVNGTQFVGDRVHRVAYRALALAIARAREV